MQPCASGPLVQPAASRPAVQGHPLTLHAFVRPGCWQCLPLMAGSTASDLCCEPHSQAAPASNQMPPGPVQVDVAVGNFEIADLLVGTVCPEHGYLARSTEAPAVVGGDEFFAPEADLQRGGSVDSRSEQPASQISL